MHINACVFCDINTHGSGWMWTYNLSDWLLRLYAALVGVCKLFESFLIIRHNIDVNEPNRSIDQTNTYGKKQYKIVIDQAEREQKNWNMKTIQCVVHNDKGRLTERKTNTTKKKRNQNTNKTLSFNGTVPRRIHDKRDSWRSKSVW